jgi:hypothetical protein
MAKGDRWPDNQNVEVRVMRDADTVLGVIRGHWRAAVRSKDSCPVRRGAVGKVPQRNSLAAYSTACPVLKGPEGSNALRVPDRLTGAAITVLRDS